MDVVAFMQDGPQSASLSGLLRITAVPHILEFPDPV
jgi:hypothetical protein